MAEVKWIKIAVDIFDNRKIKQIKKMPDGASILNIWFEMLCLAGNVNDGGFIYLTKEIPYTDEMLATHFDEPLGNVRLALNTFKNFGMIEIVDNMIFLSSWEKYQSTDKLAEIREKNRERQKRYYNRQKEKQIPAPNENKALDVTSDITLGNATDIDKSKNKNIDIDNKEKESKEKGDASQKDAKPTRHKYGTYKNVLLSDEDLEKLKAEFPTDWKNRVERLSEYIASTGKKYKNHLATIRSWARTDKAKQYDKNSAFCGSNERLDDLDDLF
jgi:predicted phage replisome organizer